MRFAGWSCRQIFYTFSFVFFFILSDVIVGLYEIISGNNLQMSLLPRYVTSRCLTIITVPCANRRLYSSRSLSFPSPYVFPAQSPLALSPSPLPHPFPLVLSPFLSLTLSLRPSPLSFFLSPSLPSIFRSPISLYLFIPHRLPFLLSLPPSLPHSPYLFLSLFVPHPSLFLFLPPSFSLSLSLSFPLSVSPSLTVSLLPSTLSTLLSLLCLLPPPSF